MSGNPAPDTTSGVDLSSTKLVRERHPTAIHAGNFATGT
jgi:hypothetical protein